MFNFGLSGFQPPFGFLNRRIYRGCLRGRGHHLPRLRHDSRRAVYSHALRPHTRGRGHGGRVSLRSSSDTAEDTGNFLAWCSANTGIADRPLRPTAPTTFPILASVLRMSHKDDAEALRKRALVHLSQAHPTTLEARGALPKLSTTRLSRGPSSATRIRSLAPRAALSGDHRRYARAGLSVGVLWQNMGREVETMRRKYDAECFAAMPLELYAEDPANVGLGCVSDIKMPHDEAREELWDDLPRIFGLGDWEKLEAVKAEAFK
ncbi:hypothetical protein B0H14DRAFT_2599064 [Mycena olivaceomarginata]|nr:hypothetical protein B0H14DRAFT_2599064 [Mycena olivaceomarginata]